MAIEAVGQWYDQQSTGVKVATFCAVAGALAVPTYFLVDKIYNAYPNLPLGPLRFDSGGFHLMKLGDIPQWMRCVHAAMYSSAFVAGASHGALGSDRVKHVFCD